MKRKRTVSRNRTLTPKQLDLIRRLCAGDSIEAAARAAGIGRTTAFKWLAEPDFKAAYETSKGEIFSGAIGKLKTAADYAARRLIILLDSKNENIVRLTAMGILEINFRIKEETEIESLLTRCEKIIKERRGGPK